MPLVGARTYAMLIPATPTYGPLARGLVANDDFLCTEIGQIGTQFDGPGHIDSESSPAYTASGPDDD